MSSQPIGKMRFQHGPIARGHGTLLNLKNEKKIQRIYWNKRKISNFRPKLVVTTWSKVKINKVIRYLGILQEKILKCGFWIKRKFLGISTTKMEVLSWLNPFRAPGTWKSMRLGSRLSSGISSIKYAASPIRFSSSSSVGVGIFSASGTSGIGPSSGFSFPCSPAGKTSVPSLPFCAGSSPSSPASQALSTWKRLIHDPRNVKFPCQSSFIYNKWPLCFNFLGPGSIPATWIIPDWSFLTICINFPVKIGLFFLIKIFFPFCNFLSKFPHLFWCRQRCRAVVGQWRVGGAGQCRRTVCSFRRVFVCNSM